MENPNSSEQQQHPPLSSKEQLPPNQLQPQQPSASSKNVKNLSIKEFFTTRLMRAKSFEGGGHSPKDEAPNWFDEFKARMTKKSQANTAKQTVSDDFNEEMSEGTSEAASKTIGQQKSGKLYQPSTATTAGKDDYNSSLVKDLCDNPLEKLAESSEEFVDNSDTDDQPAVLNSSSASVITSGLRTRKNNKISSANSPDFDTASINTIFNRRDSRYDVIRKKSRWSSSKTLLLFKKFLSFTLPLNYNLPWKLLTMINLSFVIIVLGFSNGSGPRSLTFNFFNGFVCGALVATFCFVILIMSILAQLLPTSSDEGAIDRSISATPRRNESIARSHTTIFNDTKVEKQNVTFSDKPEQRSDDSYTHIESLYEDGRLGDESQTSQARNEVILDDEDYKGWMIEFIGDYELRHKSDFKLKLIFVRIEERILYLCKPKNNHEVDSNTFPVFVQQRTYDLNTARKFSANLLLPKTVRNRQKWVWSKKYPIRLEFIDDSEVPATKTSEPVVGKTVQLTLFAKSCREKEEWFRRFKRIIEDNRLSLGNPNNRSSIRSDASSGQDIYVDAPVIHSKTIGSPSPSTMRDCVQTSQSSHILNDLKRAAEDDGSHLSVDTNLVRTKSCELLNTGKAPGNDSSSIQDCLETSDIGSRDIQFSDIQDDSTLTKETAELFSQAIEFTNFIESQPTLNYKDYIERVIESGRDATSTSDWFNALTGRILFDVFSHNYWSVWFKRKIQRKLYRIRLPYFMETLTLTHIDLGTNAPQFLNVVSHSFDSFGLSIDFDMSYSGGLTMTFETKLNLLKIKADNSTTSSGNANQSTSFGNPSCSSSSSMNFVPSQQPDTSSKDPNPSISSLESTQKDESSKPSASSSASTRTSGESSGSDESDSDSSSDSSFDEADVDEISDWEDYGAEKTRQSIVKFVDKIASSRYFQHATENRYIKKKLQDISNCPLVLIVQIQSLNGVLTVNVPPPQTDRVWYGFKPNPELTLKALPKMGDREVNLSPVTDWIEKKLAEEFRKILVIPNMEDIVLPVLKSDHLSYVIATK